MYHGYPHVITSVAVYTLILLHSDSTQIPSAKVIIIIGVSSKHNTSFVKAFKCKWMPRRNAVKSQLEYVLLTA